MLEITTHTPPQADGWEVNHLRIMDNGHSSNMLEVTIKGTSVELTAAEACGLMGALASAMSGAVKNHP